MRARVLFVVALFALAGCATNQPVPSTSPSSPSLSPSAPSSSTTPTPSPAKATTSAKPQVPSPAGALDVAKYGQAHFASPSGRIWCAMDEDGALCHFPYGMNEATVPKPEVVCPGEHLDVTGVNVSDEVGYFCSGGIESLPQTYSEYVDWWRPTKWPSVKSDGWTVATLPYGKKLKLGDFLCASERTGIVCGNTATGQGFAVALAGVTLIE